MNLNKKVHRPDRPLYTPKHLRINNSNNSLQQSPEKHGDEINLLKPVDPIINNHPGNDSMRNTSNDNHRLDSSRIVKNTETMEHVTTDANKSPITNRFRTSLIRKTSIEDDGDDDDSWFSKFSDDGNAIDPNVFKELTDKINQTTHKVEFNNNNERKEVDTKYGHLLEIYNFPKELVTQDLLMAFKDYQSKGFDIKWVDDTHAIAIFSSSVAADNALKSLKASSFKVRPIHLASTQTKSKAKNCFYDLQTSKQRPEMSAQVARNLVSAALGIKSKVSKEQRAEEKAKINDLRERKRADMKARQDAWDGNFQ